MIFGTFDILHKGHLNLFDQARKHGDFLIAVIARDRTVVKVKNREPKHNEKERLENISEHVDKAVLGNLKDKFSAIKKYKPDVICLGYDQVAFTENIENKLKELKLKTKVTRLKAHKPYLYKSSLLRN